MPVRIYDISKKLGLENKEVLAKAKELGIAAARVASSTLDKITAEYPRRSSFCSFIRAPSRRRPRPSQPLQPSPTAPCRSARCRL